MRFVRTLSAVLLVAAGALAQDEKDPRFAPAADKAAEATRQLISAESAQPPTVEWMGEYYEGDGEGVNVTLCIAPKSGYVFEWHGCLGLYDRNYGTVQSVNGHLQLTFTFENVRQGFRGIAPELLPVVWGERHYLVPSDDVIGFCNDINSGEEPRTDMHGTYLLRRGDEQKAVTGAPELPGEYREALLPRPVEATVLAIGTMTTRPSIMDWVFEDTPLTISAGSLNGLRVGMKMYVIEPARRVEWIVLTKVDEHRAEGVLTRTSDGHDPAPAAGWRFSTRPSWRPLPMEPTPPAR